MADTTRREVLTTLAVCGCCMMAGDALAGPEDRAGKFVPEKAKVGALADFAKDGIYDQHAKTKQILIVRKGDTLYAASSICTHKRCVLKKKDDHLACPCHKSEFDTDGIPMGGPAKSPLVRYAISLDNGDVIVDTNTSFAEADWGNAAAKVTVS